MPTALVTGAARGIGRAVVQSLVANGFTVAAVDLDAADVAERELDGVGVPNVTRKYVQGDVADIASHETLVRRVLAAVGTIDCLVNNAGVTSLARGDPLDLSAESFDRCMSVNLRGTFFLTQAVARHMITMPAESAPYRSIVTITSANAEIVGIDRADYCISKAALAMASKVFAARLAEHGIHVFEVRPGIIRTRMTAPATAKYDDLIARGGVPMGRWGEPEDVARTVAAIARGVLAYATGEVINVGGGLHLPRV